VKRAVLSTAVLVTLAYPASAQLPDLIPDLPTFGPDWTDLAFPKLYWTPTVGLAGGLYYAQINQLGYDDWDDPAPYRAAVVTLGIETVTNEPIQYRFKTDHLFYPLKITSTVKGSTTIELLVLTPQLLRKFPGLPVSRVELKHDPVSIDQHDLEYLDKDMHALLKEYAELKLRIWEITGDLELFKNDLIAY